jgi:hypothetical protein
MRMRHIRDTRQTADEALQRVLGLPGGGGSAVVKQPNTFYVSTSAGSDANPGTLSQPFATLAHALAVAKPIAFAGTFTNPVLILVYPGEYNENLVMPANVFLQGIINDREQFTIGDGSNTITLDPNFGTTPTVGVGGIINAIINSAVDLDYTLGTSSTNPVNFEFFNTNWFVSLNVIGNTTSLFSAINIYNSFLEDAAVTISGGMTANFYISQFSDVTATALAGGQVPSLTLLGCPVGEAGGAATLTIDATEGAMGVVAVESEIFDTLHLVSTNASFNTTSLLPPTISFADGATIAQVTQTSHIFSTNVTYTAADVANWSGTNPTSVANALDRIAAHVGPVP